MTRACRLTVLFLSLACVLAYAVPRISSVEPDAVAAGGSAVAKGADLASATVGKLYLTAAGKDVQLKITEQTAESIAFDVPEGTDMKRYRLMILTGGASPAYMEQPVALEVVDEATAKQRAEESGEVELEIIEAEPEEEAAPAGKKGKRQ